MSIEPWFNVLLLHARTAPRDASRGVICVNISRFAPVSVHVRGRRGKKVQLTSVMLLALGKQFKMGLNVKMVFTLHTRSKVECTQVGLNFGKVLQPFDEIETFQSLLIVSLSFFAGI